MNPREGGAFVKKIDMEQMEWANRNGVLFIDNRFGHGHSDGSTFEFVGKVKSAKGLTEPLKDIKF